MAMGISVAGYSNKIVHKLYWQIIRFATKETAIEEINDGEKTPFQKEWEEAIDIEDARERSLKHVDELFHKKEADSKLKDEISAFQKECEQGYTVEEARKYVLNHLHSIWKK